MLSWTMFAQSSFTLWQADHSTGQWSIYRTASDRTFRVTFTDANLRRHEIGHAGSLEDAKALVWNLLSPRQQSFADLLVLLDFAKASSFQYDWGTVDLYRSPRHKGFELIVAPGYIACDRGLNRSKTIFHLIDPEKGEMPFRYPEGVGDYRAAGLELMHQMLAEVAA